MSDLINQGRNLETWLYREKVEQNWSDIAGSLVDEIERLRQALEDVLALRNTAHMFVENKRVTMHSKTWWKTLAVTAVEIARKALEGDE